MDFNNVPAELRILDPKLKAADVPKEDRRGGSSSPSVESVLVVLLGVFRLLLFRRLRLDAAASAATADLASRLFMMGWYNGNNRKG